MSSNPKHTPDATPHVAAPAPAVQRAHLELGASGEELAVEHLVAEGWTIRERNYTTKIGEIDIIAQREEARGRGQIQVLAFVEVKTRRSSRRLNPAASVTHKKRRKLSALARQYLKRHRLHGMSCRFDVIAVEFDVRPPRIRHIPGAFDVLGRVR